MTGPARQLEELFYDLVDDEPEHDADIPCDSCGGDGGCPVCGPCEDTCPCSACHGECCCQECGA